MLDPLGWQKNLTQSRRGAEFLIHAEARGRGVYELADKTERFEDSSAGLCPAKSSSTTRPNFELDIELRVPAPPRENFYLCGSGPHAVAMDLREKISLMETKTPAGLSRGRNSRCGGNVQADRDGVKYSF